MSESSDQRSLEIRDWIHALGRRLAVLIAVPVLAGGVAGAISARQLQQYRTTTTVVIAHPQTSGPESAAVSQAVDDFQGALSSQSVATLTAQQTGAPLKNVLGGLSSARRGSSNSVDVTYVGTSKDVAPKVVVAASKNALETLAQSDLALASAQVDAAKLDYDQALEQLTQLSTDSNIVEFPGALGAYEKLLRDGRDALSRAVASKNQKAIARAKHYLATVTAAAVKLKASYQSAIDHLGSARASYTSALSAQMQAQGEVGAAQTVQLTPGPAVALSRSAHAAKRVIPAMVFGLVLAVGLVVLLEALRPRGRSPARW